MDAICQKHREMVGVAFCPHCVIDSLKQQLTESKKDAERCVKGVRSAPTPKWTACTDRLPMPGEGHEGYFWCWNERTPEEPPSILESWETDGVPMGFCHEACGIVKEVTHWQPAIPPKAPNAELRGRPLADGPA